MYLSGEHGDQKGRCIECSIEVIASLNSSFCVNNDIFGYNIYIYIYIVI